MTLKGSFFNKGRGQKNAERRAGPVKYRLNSVVGINLDTGGDNDQLFRELNNGICPVPVILK